jgi:hypothetical protein
MKLAGIILGFVGGWTVATVGISIMAACTDKRPCGELSTEVAQVAPWTAILALGIGLIFAGIYLFDKNST